MVDMDQVALGQISSQQLVHVSGYRKGVSAWPLGRECMLRIHLPGHWIYLVGSEYLWSCLGLMTSALVVTDFCRSAAHFGRHQ